MIRLFAASIVVISMMVTPSTGAEEAAKSDEVRFSVTNLRGTGCPTGTANVVSSNYGQVFTVFYEAYSVAVGPKTNHAGRLKDCQLDVRVDVPDGHTFGEITMDYRGDLKLPKGSRGRLDVDYSFTGWAKDRKTTHVLEGENDYDWFHRRDTIKMDDGSPSTCGGSAMLKIRTELKIDKVAPGSENIISMNTNDGGIPINYRWNLRKCFSE